MNKLVTTNDGGFPLKMDDFKWMQDATREALKGLISSYLDSSGVLILSGLEKTNIPFPLGSYEYREGYVFINGEVCYVPGLTMSYLVVGADAYLIPVTSFDPAGIRMFKDASSHDTYQINTAKIIITANPPANAILLSSINRIEDVVYEWMNNKIIPSSELLNITIPNTGLIPGTYILKGSVDFSKYKRLSGRVYCEDIQVGDTIAQLPPDYYPNETLMLGVIGYSGADSVQLRVELNQLGKLICRDFLSPQMSAFILSLDGVEYS